MGKALTIYPLILLLNTVVGATGQEPGKASPGAPGARLSHRDNLPSSIAAASVPLIDQTGSVPVQIRTVQVYPEDQNSRVRVPGRYYHRPLLAFVENPHPIASFPSIVHNLDTESDEHGSILLKFLVRRAPEISGPNAAEPCWCPTASTLCKPPEPKRRLWCSPGRLSI